MAVSAYCLFMRNTAKLASLKNLSIPARGKAVAKLYKALPAAEKAALIKTAKATKPFKATKVRISVLKKAMAKGIPLKFVRKSWYATKGTTTAGKLNVIAKKNGIKVRRAPKTVKKVAKKADKKKADKKADKKKVSKK